MPATINMKKQKKNEKAQIQPFGLAPRRNRPSPPARRHRCWGHARRHGAGAAASSLVGEGRRWGRGRGEAPASRRRGSAALVPRCRGSTWERRQGGEEARARARSTAGALLPTKSAPPWSRGAGSTASSPVGEGHGWGSGRGEAPACAPPWIHAGEETGRGGSQGAGRIRRQRASSHRIRRGSPPPRWIDAALEPWSRIRRILASGRRVLVGKGERRGPRALPPSAPLRSEEGE